LVSSTDRSANWAQVVSGVGAGRPALAKTAVSQNIEKEFSPRPMPWILPSTLHRSSTLVPKASTSSGLGMNWSSAMVAPRRA
jgi:hypothetical protein